jgi:prolyl-tRNA synthetase
MRWSVLFIPTLREAPADAEAASHKLLLRAGYIRQLGAGIYSFLFLGWRSALKITQIIREEMDRMGAQEFFLPALNPAEIWQESGRWDQFGETMFKFKDRAGRDVCLGVTHEEVMTDIARHELRSYRQLPQIWYQIQTKFRDEARPKSGLMRLRQFIMKDSYSFDLDEAGLEASYRKHYDAYCAIYDRCMLRYKVVEAHSGAMGGAVSHEFMVLSDAGEDQVAICECGYAANLEKAKSIVAPVKDNEAALSPEAFATPNIKTIEELAGFTGTGPEYMAKSLVYMVEGEPLLVQVRGDHQLNEAKLSDALKGGAWRPAHPDEIRGYFGAGAGSIGAVGVRGMRILADDALRGRKNLLTGANRDDFHLRNVTPGEDFEPEYADLRTVRNGEICIQCKQKKLKVSKAIEVGHIFKLGRRYCEAMGAKVLDESGKEITMIMGSYGIGVERILTAAVEQNQDEDGMFLPRSIAPFEVVLTPVNYSDAGQREVAEKVYKEMLDAGFDVLYDDRDERPGVKFKDADLIGVPYRVTVGQRVAEGKVEIRDRSTRKITDVRIGEVLKALRSEIVRSKRA